MKASILETLSGTSIVGTSVLCDSAVACDEFTADTPDLFEENLSVRNPCAGLVF